MQIKAVLTVFAIFI